MKKDRHKQDYVWISTVIFFRKKVKWKRYCEPETYLIDLFACTNYYNLHDVLMNVVDAKLKLAEMLH